MRFRPNLLTLERRDVPSTGIQPFPGFRGEVHTSAVGHVRVFDGVTGAEVRYLGDVNGQADVIVGATVNGHVKVFDGQTGDSAAGHVRVFDGAKLVAGGTATDPTGNTYYVGSDNGGVWKSVDGDANGAGLNGHNTGALRNVSGTSDMRTGSVYTITFGGNLA